MSCDGCVQRTDIWQLKAKWSSLDREHQVGGDSGVNRYLMVVEKSGAADLWPSRQAQQGGVGDAHARLSPGAQVTCADNQRMDRAVFRGPRAALCGEATEER